MGKRKKALSELLPDLSQGKKPPDFSPEIIQDTLSIVIDALNSSINGTIITDLQGSIRFVNPSFCKMFDYSPDKVVGMNATDLFATKEVKTFSDVLSIIDISQDDTKEFIVETSRGESFIVEVSASHVTSSSGQIVGRMASFSDITKRKEMETDRENLIIKLQEALHHVKTLRGIIPICASCKKIRDDKGYWSQVEEYVHAHTEADFTHSICPECAKILYPDFV